MIIGERFPIGYQYLLKDLGFYLGVHLHAYPVGGIARDHIDHGVAEVKSYHQAKGLDKLARLMTCDDIYHILGYQPRNERYDRTDQSEGGIESHYEPITLRVTVDPFCLTDKFLQSALFDSLYVEFKLFFHRITSVL